MSETPKTIEDLFRAASSLVGTKREDAQIELLWKYVDAAPFSERLRFLQSVLSDENANDLVRIEAMKAAAEARTEMSDQEKLLFGSLLITLSKKSADYLTRLWAVRQMQWFVDVSVVLNQAVRILVDESAAIDIRIAALSSIERGGPNPSSISLLKSFAPGSELGGYASRVLEDWQR